jgi:hypothetical protein
MWHRHGDPLYADKKKVFGLPNGEHHRRGYKMVCPVAEFPVAIQSNEQTEKSDALSKQAFVAHGFRDGSGKNYRVWEHRKITDAKKGEIVHHIDLNPGNNDRLNLHVFPSPKEHGAAHRSLELVAVELLMKGLVEFDRTSGTYRLTESFRLSI